MATLTLSLSTSHDTDVLRQSLSFGEKKNLHDFMQSVAGAMDDSATCSVLVKMEDGASATGTVTVNNASLANGDILTVGDVDLTCGTEFTKGGSSTLTASSIADAINDNCTGMATAESALAVVTITCASEGVLGNLVSLAKTEATPGALTLSGSALSGGLNDSGESVDSQSV